MGDFARIRGYWVLMKCGLAGLIGGIVIVSVPELEMFWPGVLAIVVGAGILAAVIYRLARRPKSESSKEPPN